MTVKHWIPEALRDLAETLLPVPHETNQIEGLPGMLLFTKAAENGELAIYSPRRFFRNSGREKMQVVGKFAKPIKGILIVWMLNFSGITP